MTSALTAEDMFGSLNGFDEIAIAQAFKADITTLRHRPLAFLRALAFVNERRQGSPDATAYTTVMEMPVSEVDSYFPETEVELDATDPDGDQGKADAPSE